jgi:hypothetical protein
LRFVVVRPLRPGRFDCRSAPDCELDPIERLELEVASAWSDYRIRAEAMWEGIFERLGLAQGFELGETY